MKKLFLLLVFPAMVACNKEADPQPRPVPPECKCGKVISANMQDFSILVENKCTKNRTTFKLLPNDWIRIVPGNEYCSANQW